MVTANSSSLAVTVIYEIGGGGSSASRTLYPGIPAARLWRGRRSRGVSKPRTGAQGFCGSPLLGSTAFRSTQPSRPRTGAVERNHPGHPGKIQGRTGSIIPEPDPDQSPSRNRHCAYAHLVCIHGRLSGQEAVRYSVCPHHSQPGTVARLEGGAVG